MCFTKKICKKPRSKNRRVKSEKQKLRDKARMKQFLERKQNLSHFPFSELDPLEFKAHVKPNIHLRQEICSLTRKLQVAKQSTQDAQISSVLQTQANIDRIEQENLGLHDQLNQLHEMTTQFKTENVRILNQNALLEKSLTDASIAEKDYKCQIEISKCMNSELTAAIESMEKKSANGCSKCCSPTNYHVTYMYDPTNSQFIFGNKQAEEPVSVPQLMQELHKVNEQCVNFNKLMDARNNTQGLQQTRDHRYHGEHHNYHHYRGNKYNYY